MQRLKTRAQFQAALAGGTLARTPHFALHRCALGAAARTALPETAAASSPRQAALLFHVEDVWLGAMVPKRWARRAVTRNAIKRQIYAVGILHEAGLAPAAHVVRLRAGFDRKEFVSATSERLKAAVRAELEQLFVRAARGALPQPSMASPAPALP